MEVGGSEKGQQLFIISAYNKFSSVSTGTLAVRKFNDISQKKLQNFLSIPFKDTVLKGLEKKCYTIQNKNSYEKRI